MKIESFVNSLENKKSAFSLISSIIIAFSFLWMILLYFFVPQLDFHFLLGYVFALSCLIFLISKKYPNYNLLSFVLILLIMVLFFFIVLRAEGGDYVLLFYALMPFVASLIYNSRGIGIVFILSTMLSAILLYAPLDTFHTIAKFEADFLHLVVLIFVACVTALFAWLTTDMRAKSIERYSNEYRKRVHESKLNQQSILFPGISFRILKSIANIDTLVRSLREKLEHDEKQVLFLDKIKNGASRIANIVDSLIIIAEDAPDIEKNPLSLMTFLKEIEEEVRLIVPDGKVDVILPVKDVKMMTNETYLKQVIYNLVNNSNEAISHDENPFIMISCNIKQDKVVFEIIDSGKGIDQDLLDDIFTPFFTTKEKTKGTGLGLALSLRIAKSLGGDLYYDFRQNTCFVLEIPIAKDSK